MPAPREFAARRRRAARSRRGRATIVACIASFAALLLLAPPVAGAAAAAAAAKIPILTEPLVPFGAPARVIAGEVVTAGVPFAPEEGLNDVASLRLRGASAAQFRVLQRDPNSGHVTWALVTFVADGGPYAVERVAGAAPAGGLARDAGDTIVVDTGAAQFTLRKQRFNGFERVVHRGATRVRPHAGGGVVVSVDGVRFESGFDPGSETVVEDDGPARAVVRSRGTLRDARGTPSLRYTVRMQFDRGRSDCRVFVTLRNADRAAPRGVRFDAAWFEVPLELGPEREVRFGFPGEGFWGRLGRGAKAHLFQADNSVMRHPRTVALLPHLGTAVGLEVELDGAVHNALGTRTDAATGWLRLDDGTQAVLAGMRDLAPQFPNGFDLDGDRLAVELFSRHNPKHGLLFAWGAHETRELLFEWAAQGADPAAFGQRLQAPPLGRCTFERYRDTGAFCGERRLVSVEEESRFFGELGRRWQPPRFEAGDLALVRRQDFRTTGGPNQFDQDECLLLEYARAGNAGAFLQARLGVLRKADQAVVHSDDFDHGALRNGVDRLATDDADTFHGRGCGNTFDDEHPHWVCMLHYWHLTGDERVREAILDYGEWRRYRAGHPLHGARFGGALHHMRLWSRCLRDMALLWETTGDRRDLHDLRTMATALVTTIERDGSRGRNLERGYFYFGDPADPKRRIHLFFLTEMNSLAVHEAMRVLPADDPLREELRDYLSGLAWFTLQEAQILPAAPGYPYGYFAAAPNPETGSRGDQTGTLLVHGYETSGDPEFIARARALAWRVPQDSHPLRASEPATHVRIYRWLHRDAASALLVAPQVEPHADGSYTLKWRSPPGARTVVVKYGTKRLVETLDFDPVRRTFAADTAAAMPFWAATNLHGEPPAPAAGGMQTWRTPPLPPGRRFFAVKLLGDGRLRGSGTPVAPSDPNAATGAGIRAPRSEAPRRPRQPGDALGCRRNWRRRIRSRPTSRALPHPDLQIRAGSSGRRASGSSACRSFCSVG
jgi:hypothetical protein